MPAVSNVLVIGAGAAGTAAAILLAEGGVDVEVAEINPEVSALGSGITLRATRCASSTGSASGRSARRRATASTRSACAPPTRTAPSSSRCPT